MTSSTPDRAQRLAQRQFDVITRRQALDCAVSRKAIEHRLHSGRWQRLHRGVYATRPGVVPWMTRASGAVLHLGPGATLALNSAAYLWGLVERPPAVLQLAVPRGRHLQRPIGIRVCRRTTLERRVWRQLPVTSPAQTVVDLADVPGCSDDEVIALLTTLVRTGRGSAAEVLTELDRRRAHRRRGLIRVAVGPQAEGVESVAEHHFLTRVERAHRLPAFARQTPTGDGGRRDFENREFGVIVEVDGYLWHAVDAFHSDRRRDRRAAAQGRITLRAGWVDVWSQPCALALDVALTLRTRGWTGRLRPCGPRCTAGGAAS